MSPVVRHQPFQNQRRSNNSQAWGVWGMNNKPEDERYEKSATNWIVHYIDEHFELGTVQVH